MGTFWLLLGGVVLGVVLLLTTHGLAHTLGGGLAGACLVVAFQVRQRVRRAGRSDPDR